MDPSVAVTRMPPRHSFHVLFQGWLVGPVVATVSQNRARPTHDAADPPLRDPVVLAEIVGGGPLLVGAHHFFSRMANLTGEAQESTNFYGKRSLLLAVFATK